MKINAQTLHERIQQQSLLLTRATFLVLATIQMRPRIERATDIWRTKSLIPHVRDIRIVCDGLDDFMTSLTVSGALFSTRPVDTKDTQVSLSEVAGVLWTIAQTCRYALGCVLKQYDPTKTNDGWVRLVSDQTLTEIAGVLKKMVVTFRDDFAPCGLNKQRRLLSQIARSILEPGYVSTNLNFKEHLLDPLLGDDDTHIVGFNDLRISCCRLYEHGLTVVYGGVSEVGTTGTGTADPAVLGDYNYHAPSAIIEWVEQAIKGGFESHLTFDRSKENHTYRFTAL